jgi:hypothetical protein
MSTTVSFTFDDTGQVRIKAEGQHLLIIGTGDGVNFTYGDIVVQVAITSKTQFEEQHRDIFVLREMEKHWDDDNPALD